MGEFDHIFGGVQDAQRMGQRTPRLQDGNYELLLDRYAPAASKTNNGNRLEADFMVLQSDNPNIRPDETRGWAWFPDTNGWAGVYEKDRARGFIEGAAQALGLQEEVKTVGARLAMGQLRGLKVRVSVTPQLDSKTGARKVGKSGPYSNAEWVVVPQTREELAQNAALVESKKGPLRAAAPTPPAQPNHAPQQMFGGAPQPSAPPQQMFGAQAQPAFQGAQAQPAFQGAQAQPFPGAQAQPFPGAQTATNPFAGAPAAAAPPMANPFAPQAGNPFAPAPGAGPNPLAAITGGLKPF